MHLEEWRKKNPFFIKKITINNLVSKYNILWELTDINILVGNNGSGKSTIFKLAQLGLQDIRSFDQNSIGGILGKFDSMEIELNNGKKGKVKISDGHEKNDYMLKLLSELIENEKFTSQSSHEEIEKIRKTIKNIENIKSSTSDITRYILEGQSEFFSKNEGDISYFNKNISIEFISTFDMLLLSQEKYDKYSGKLYSELDVVIKEELDKLKDNIIQIKDKTKRDFIRKNNSKSLQEVDDKNNAKIDTLNNELAIFFKESGKKVLVGKNGELSISSNGQRLSTRNLSSGEKQLILILIKTLNCSLFNPCLIFMDEPEISLHVAWQMNLINSLKKIADQSQIIVVTHSPALVMANYKSKMVDIKDLVF
ncbi:ATP-binding protein [Aeromonas caviae]|uniref:ATP-binding protein n=1 Tax=Aeromonas caviae TaxID=648 RepID=UPI003014B2D0